MENYFAVLNNMNVSEKTENKNGLTYLSWVWAWGELKKLHPDATYKVYENSDGWNYHTDGRTCWVKTGVTVNGIEHIEYLPVMDYRNSSIAAGKVTSFDVNKAIQRSLTKAIARHGLGLYIYAGEDLPEEGNPKAEAKETQEKREAHPKPSPADDKPGLRIPPKEDKRITCEMCKKYIADYWDGEKLIKAATIAQKSQKATGKTLCFGCGKAVKNG